MCELLMLLAAVSNWASLINEQPSLFQTIDDEDQGTKWSFLFFFFAPPFFLITFLR